MSKRFEQVSVSYKLTYVCIYISLNTEQPPRVRFKIKTASREREKLSTIDNSPFFFHVSFFFIIFFFTF